ncbi:hypothetical protein CspHIS471_0605100 [Cutaneotrichosporon sp. HIS471]|nr:hypothetical protein CspHIS471_0605100 [Cutaneotrichosporon sp. HIS471]
MFSLLLVLLPLISASPVELETRDRATAPAGWKSYGCHFDCYDGMNRYLPHKAYSNDHNSPRKCTKACEKAGYKFAGVQFGKECWCGNEVGGQLTDDKECFIQCPKAAKETCGGPCRNFIYGLA